MLNNKAVGATLARDCGKPAGNDIGTLRYRELESFAPTEFTPN